MRALASAGELDEATPNYDELVSKRIQVRTQVGAKLEELFNRLRSVNTERQAMRVYRYFRLSSRSANVR